MSAPNSFASFAAYTPPPDVHSEQQQQPRPWFPSQQNPTSYQSGGIPTFAAPTSAAAVDEVESQQNQWETRHGLRVDLLAALAYVLGPISALALLILETQNDYVRFHAYQSALLTTPLVIIRIFASLLQFPGWIRSFFTILLLLAQGYMAAHAYMDAQSGLTRFQLPYIGQISARWLEDE
ncbi:hypothetical protein MKEN_00817700 [Mycena kentingensis (nom. inval.)]|nr:hypothetical protein MKEN_00817700 [Mycena kentingensis (nom. inval.)]